LPLIIQTLR